MDVRVGTSQRISAMLACSAGPRVRSGAHQSLPEPEGETLLAHAKGAVQQEGSRQHVTANRVVKPRSQRFMTVDGEKGHRDKLRAQWGRVRPGPAHVGSPAGAAFARCVAWRRAGTSTGSIRPDDPPRAPK